jgi:hypothetical protein
MFLPSNCTLLVTGILLTFGSFAFGQQQTGALVVRGYAGQAPVVNIQGRAFVDVEALAQITNGSVGLNNGRIELTLPHPPDTEGAQPAGFSRPFMSASIEAIACMREWGSTLVVAIQNSYPVGNAMPVYRGRALDRLRAAEASIATDSDRSGFDLLRNEFTKVQAWSDKLVNAQKTMSAGNLATSEDALKQDPLFQGIVQCGQFLGQMLAGGTFQDDSSCH